MTAFRDRGDEVIISAPLDEKAPDVEKLGFKLIDTQFNRQGKNPIVDFKLILHYRKMIKQVDPDVVLTYTIKPNLYGGMACQLCHVPQIANVTGLGVAVEYPGMLQELTMLLYKIGMRKTRLTFFQNPDKHLQTGSGQQVHCRPRLTPYQRLHLSSPPIWTYSGRSPRLLP